MESEEYDRYPTALVHERRTLTIQDTADTATQELCGRVGNTRKLDVVSHMGVKPLRHRSVIGTDDLQGHVLRCMGTVGQRCLMYHFLDIGV